MTLNALHQLTETYTQTAELPVLFVGHGSPMNAIEDNVFTREMKAIAEKISKPKAILMISAHWETKGTYVTIQDKPRTIHDFGGFPQALFDVQYPAPGSKWLAEETRAAVTDPVIGFDEQWGFDHGCWSVTKNMYPEADVPIIQLSLDYSQPAQYHYDLALQLAALRKKGVLIIGSGNMVHNLRKLAISGNDFNAPFAFDWALEASTILKKLILEDDHKALIHYTSLGKAVALAVPTPEHYLPLLYALALKGKNEELNFFNDIPVGGSITMTSLVIDPLSSFRNNPANT